MKGDLHGRAGRQEPVRQRELRSGEPARGPQHQVKPAASTHLQPAGRAAHFTAKATSIVGAPKPAMDCGGVWGAARVQGEVRNTRDPSVPPSSGRGGSYKPKAKSSAVQRESEGIVVPQSVAQAARTNAVKNNAAGGKDPCGGRAEGAGKHERMAGKTDLTTPAAMSRTTKCDNCNDSYGPQPSGHRVGAFTRCMTTSGEVTFSGRRGGE